AIKRELQEGEYKDGQLAKKINRVLRKSIIYAYEHPLESKSFIMNNAQEITEQVQQKHINLFVNNFTLDIGEQGEKAVNFLYEKYRQTIEEQKNNL
ncbi:MAG: MqnA/MqnD/SBP family protein, partial [Bacteroidales bacterium]